jgi:gliding motility-associated-like protein
VVVPNVITVNGDGTNDDWEIENIDGYPNVIIEIYNRWGNLVWKTEGYPKNWDGTNFRNGEVLADGTYFYIINLQSQIYKEPLTGWVQIIK